MVCLLGWWWWWWVTLVLHGEIGGDQGRNLTPDVCSIDLPSAPGLVILYDLGLEESHVVSYLLNRYQLIFIIG